MAFKIPDNIAIELEKNNLGFRVGMGLNKSFCEIVDKLANDAVIIREEADDVGVEAEKAALNKAYATFQRAGRPKTQGQAILEAVSKTSDENAQLRAELEALKAKLATAEPDEKTKKNK